MAIHKHTRLQIWIIIITACFDLCRSRLVEKLDLLTMVLHNSSGRNAVPCAIATVGYLLGEY